jgi:hypothetical protein
VKRLVERLWAWIDAEASTRPAGLLRIGLALIILARFGDKMMLGRDTDAFRAGLMVTYWLGSLAMLFGVFSQVSSAVMAAVVAVGVWKLGRADESWRHFHVQLLVSALWCVALAPCGRSYSWDRWRALARAEQSGAPAPPEHGPLWAQRLIALQVTAMYFWAAQNKCTIGWLSGGKLESQLMFHYFDSDPPMIVGWHLMVQTMAVATVVIEFGLAFGLWWRRARRWLIPAGIGFHLLIYVTFPVTVFSMLTCFLYLAYCDPDAVHRGIDRLSGRS